MLQSAVRILKAFVVLTLLLGTVGFVLTLAWRGFNETEWRAATFAELEAGGAFGRGVVPDYFPRSARDIHFVHNNDTTASRATFRYERGTARGVRETCRRVAATDRGEKFLCPPYDTRTVTVLLRNDGTGRYRSRPDRI